MTASPRSINSPAITDPDLIGRLSQRFGAQCVVIGIDSQTVDGDFHIHQFTGDPSRTRATARKTPDWVRDVLSPTRVAEAGLFAPALVESLYDKCARKVREAAGSEAPLSNADNMALIGVLTAQLAWEQLVRTVPRTSPADSGPAFTTVIDRVG